MGMNTQPFSADGTDKLWAYSSAPIRVCGILTKGKQQKTKWDI